MEQQTPPSTPSNTYKKNHASFMQGKFLIAFIILLLIILASLSVALFIHLYRNNPGSQQNPGDLLVVDQTEITGKIENIQGKTLTVTRSEFIYKEGDLKSPEEKKTTYLVEVSDSTLINKNPAPYSLSSSDSAIIAPTYQLNDLKKGQTVSAVSKEGDPISGNRFEAFSIVIQSGLTTIAGVIESRTGNNLTIKSGPPSLPVEKNFEVSLDNQTQIGKIGSETVQPITNLSPGTQILIHSLEDVNLSQNLTALKIEIF